VLERVGLGFAGAGLRSGEIGSKRIALEWDRGRREKGRREKGSREREGRNKLLWVSSPNLAGF